MRGRYKAIGDAQKHVFGEGLPGSKPPNFNLAPPATGVSAPAPGTTASPTGRTGPAASTGSTVFIGANGRPRPLMDYSSGPVLLNSQRENQISRFRAWIVLAVPLAAILFQLFVPRFFEFLGFIEMPLLVVVYFALVRRSQIAGLFTGALVGLAQDSLNKTPVGMLGDRRHAGRLFRRIRRHAHRCGPRRGAPAADILLLLLLSGVVLGDGARAVEPAERSGSSSC